MSNRCHFLALDYDRLRLAPTLLGTERGFGDVRKTKPTNGVSWAVLLAAGMLSLWPGSLATAQTSSFDINSLPAPAGSDDASGANASPAEKIEPESGDAEDPASLETIPSDPMLSNSPVQDPQGVFGFELAPVQSAEPPPLLRPGVSSDSPMDIGISKEESETNEGEAAEADSAGTAGDTEGETGLDSDPGTDIESEPLLPHSDGNGEERADADPVSTIDSELEAEVSNAPAQFGFPEAREELRTSGAVAVLRGLDKITARISIVEAPVGQPVLFGKLEVTASYCYKRPPEEPPEVSAFVQVRDLRKANQIESEADDLPPVQPIAARAKDAVDILGEDSVDDDAFDEAMIFSGWMFASSPALHAVEHPVYDVWLIDCKAETPESSFGGLSNEPMPKELDSKRP